MFEALRSLTADGRLLFATRFVRLFAYGALSIVLVLYLVGLGLTESATGVLLTATLLGDTVVSLYLTTRADRFGRRRMLIVGALLMVVLGDVGEFDAAEHAASPTTTANEQNFNIPFIEQTLLERSRERIRAEEGEPGAGRSR